MHLPSMVRFHSTELSGNLQNRVSISLSPLSSHQALLWLALWPTPAMVAVMDLRPITKHDGYIKAATWLIIRICRTKSQDPQDSDLPKLLLCCISAAPAHQCGHLALGITLPCDQHTPTVLMLSCCTSRVSCKTQYGKEPLDLCTNSECEVQEVDVDLDGLDWIVCHSGADIWHAQTDGEWNADEQWENLVDFRCTSHILLQSDFLIAVKMPASCTLIRFMSIV